jgi:hypothetical protein
MGLAIAERQVRWWLDNGAYPIFFVWESGIEGALRQLLAAAGGQRSFGEDLVDRLTEQVARNLGGVKIWSAMKRSAELASAPDGGAWYVAQRLRQ